MANPHELAPTLLKYVDYIGGELTTPSVECDGFLCNPNTGESVMRQMATDDFSIEVAINCAYRAHKRSVWSGLPAHDRASFLEAIGREVAKYEDNMARLDAFNTGVVLGMTLAIAPSLKTAFFDAASKLRDPSSSAQLHKLPGHFGNVHACRRPWGVSAVLAPWNVPAGSVAPKIAAALAAGAPVILKPSEWAPLSLGLFARAIADAGLPVGAFQLINGGPTVGQRLVTDPRIRCVNFTGSVPSGRQVASDCSRLLKPCMLELGGSNPLVVFEDADLDKAVDGIVQGLTLLNGQWCCGLGRIFVHESIQDALMEKTMARLSEVKIGNSMDTESEMGPLGNPTNCASVSAALEHLKEIGGIAHTSTPLPCEVEHNKGLFFPPTLVTGVSVEDAQTEIFGPVATVHPFRTEVEAINTLNIASGMLVCYIYSSDTERAFRVGWHIETGMAMVNGVGFGFVMEEGTEEPIVSFWNVSGLGEDGTMQTLMHFFSGNRVVGVNGLMAETDTNKVQEASQSPERPSLRGTDFRTQFYRRLHII